MIPSYNRKFYDIKLKILVEEDPEKNWNISDVKNKSILLEEKFLSDYKSWDILNLSSPKLVSCRWYKLMWEIYLDVGEGFPLSPNFSDKSAVSFYYDIRNTPIIIESSQMPSQTLIGNVSNYPLYCYKKEKEKIYYNIEVKGKYNKNGIELTENDFKYNIPKNEDVKFPYKIYFINRKSERIENSVSLMDILKDIDEVSTKPLSYFIGAGCEEENIPEKYKTLLNELNKELKTKITVFYVIHGLIDAPRGVDERKKLHVIYNVKPDWKGERNYPVKLNLTADWLGKGEEMLKENRIPLRLGDSSPNEILSLSWDTNNDTYDPYYIRDVEISLMNSKQIFFPISDNNKNKFDIYLSEISKKMGKPPANEPYYNMSISGNLLIGGNIKSQEIIVAPFSPNDIKHFMLHYKDSKKDSGLNTLDAFYYYIPDDPDPESELILEYTKDEKTDYCKIDKTKVTRNIISKAHIKDLLEQEQWDKYEEELRGKRLEIVSKEKSHSILQKIPLIKKYFQE
jgi:hypothetical protein